jgi:membrane-bound lytic murein transglycosylase D
MTKRTGGALALVLSLIGGILLGGTSPAGAARSKPKAKPKSKSHAHSTGVLVGPPSQADFEAGRALLEMQDRYDKARSLYGKKQHDAALAELDIIVPRLNTALETTPDKRIRSALGTLLSRSGSLRLAATKARDAQAAAAAKTFVGPTPVAGSSSDAPTPVAKNEDEKTADSTVVAEPAVAPEVALPEGDEGDDTEDAFDLPAVDEDDPNAIAIEQHPRVAKWLDYFTGRGRGTFERWLERSGLYMGWMKRVLEREGVPTDLVHLVFVESGFNPHARSYASAVGPWQFIRGTAKMFGLTVNSWIDERKDPEASTVAAARYLKHLNGLFNSWPLALASYNAGEQTVINAVKRQGTRDFWSLNLPQQTEDYVPKFMAVLAIARDPKRYGFDEVSISAPMAYDEVSLPAPVDLRALANACDVEVAEIQRLNPALLKYAAPGKGEEITLRVPEGSGDKIRSSLEDGSLELPRIETPPDPVVLRHKVRRGESLKALSLRYGIPASRIASYNRIGKKSRLKVGRTVLIPMQDAGSRLSKAAPKPKRENSQARVAKQGGDDADDAAVKTIQVKRGQTLSAIAAKHGTTVAELRALNGMSRKASVKAGQRLKVPAES